MRKKEIFGNAGTKTINKNFSFNKSQNINLCVFQSADECYILGIIIKYFQIIFQKGG